MAATIIGTGTNLAFGIASAQTGMVIKSISSSASADAVELKNKSGDVTAVASSGIGQALALTSNSTAVSSGSYFVTDASFSEASDGFSTFDLSATAYTGLNT